MDGLGCGFTTSDGCPRFQMADGRQMMSDGVATSNGRRGRTAKSHGQVDRPHRTARVDGGLFFFT